MAFNFHANQYEKTFHPVSLQNWQLPKEFGPLRYNQVPSRREGTTEIIASERGHLSTGVPRSRTSPWGTYVGTWDMPNKLPGMQMTNTTARSESAAEKLLRCKTEGDIILSGKLKKSRIPPPLPCRPDIEAGPTGDILVELVPSASKSDSGVRSGARNPSPKSGTPQPYAPQPDTLDNIKWPCPTDVPCGAETRDAMATSPGGHQPIPQALETQRQPTPLDQTPGDIQWPVPKSVMQE